MRPADGSLGVPVVQSAKISFSAGDGTVQTHEIQHLDQLPAVLVGVLQGAVHTQVQWTLVGGSAGSSYLADTLISTITTSGSTMKDATAIATADHSSPDAVSTQSHDVAAATSHGAAVSAVELQAILESFIQSTPNYSIISTGAGSVVIYDPHALISFEGVKPVIFDFGDGSSLSLVGLPAAMQHAYLMA
jgi:hypothetical protein